MRSCSKRNRDQGGSDIRLEERVNVREQIHIATGESSKALRQVHAIEEKDLVIERNEDVEIAFWPLFSSRYAAKQPRFNDTRRRKHAYEGLGDEVRPRVSCG